MSSQASSVGVVSFVDARRIVEEHAAEVLATRADIGPTETMELLAARGRVLAETVVSDRDFPPFPRATRDGYAVRAADVQQVPARLEVVGEIKAGDGGGNSRDKSESRAAAVVQSGRAIAIMTGAGLPAGADAVVMVEYTATSGKFVDVLRSVQSGENFVPLGAEARAGQLLVESGRRLDHSLVAIAAAVGRSRVTVFRKPRVAVLATGDEIVELGSNPGPAQIRNSNSYSLAAQIEEAGGEAVRLAIAPDEPVRLRELIEQGLACDLLLITGGVSMGKYDLVEQVLAELDADFYFTGAHIHPGKPIVFGSCGAKALARWREAHCQSDVSGLADRSSASDHPKKPARHYFFGLPGNPVSTIVTFRLFVQPMLAALAGARPESLVFPKARLKAEVRTKTGLTRFLPATVLGTFDAAEVELVSWKGSGDIAALARANCYLVVPPDRERLEAGEWVSVLLG